MDPFTLALIGGALLALLTIVALRITAWIVKVAIKAIIGLIKNIQARVGVVRKRNALKKFIELARKSGDHEVEGELENIRKKHQALMTPLDENGEEEWEKLKVVAPDSDEDDLVDGFMVSETGRVEVISGVLR